MEMEGILDKTVVKKVTFTRDLTDEDFRDIRNALGHKVLQEGGRYIVVAFDNEIDYLAFMIAIGQVTMKGVVE